MKDAESIVRIAQAAGEIGKATSPVASMRALDALAADLIGHRMFTGLLYHPDTQETERFYTNHPEKYPLGGRKPPRRDRWSSAVIDRGEIFFLSSPQDVKDNFADAATLIGIGIGCGMCLPVRLNNRTLGTINVLAPEGTVSERHAPIGQIIATLAVPVFEAEHQARRQGRGKA